MHAVPVYAPKRGKLNGRTAWGVSGVTSTHVRGRTESADDDDLVGRNNSLGKSSLPQKGTRESHHDQEGRCRHHALSLIIPPHHPKKRGHSGAISDANEKGLTAINRKPLI
jgi:hypothetical protein